jgi:pSer/pThr/pTyr-binding forkhead associated (FHA) protein
MKARIRVVEGPLSGQTIEIRSRLLVGREQDCDLCPPCEFVSRHHCVLLLDNFALRIRDLGSKNGTFINGHRIVASEMLLLHDDLVSVGVTKFRIELSPQTEEVNNPSTTSSIELTNTGVVDTSTLEQVAVAPFRPADKPQEGRRPLP